MSRPTRTGWRFWIKVAIAAPLLVAYLWRDERDGD
jgi:hypothetical protein